MPLSLISDYLDRPHPQDGIRTQCSPVIEMEGARKDYEYSDICFNFFLAFLLLTY